MNEKKRSLARSTEQCTEQRHEGRSGCFLKMTKPKSAKVVSRRLVEVHPRQTNEQLACLWWLERREESKEAKVSLLGFKQTKKRVRHGGGDQAVGIYDVPRWLIFGLIFDGL